MTRTMNSMTFGIGLFVGGLLAVSSAQAQNGGHDQPTNAVQNEPAIQEQKEEIKLQTTCPIMGGAIDKALYVDHAGKRIYVCCKGCIAAVKKDPAKIIQAMEAAGVALHPAVKDAEPAEPNRNAGDHEGHQH